MNRASKRALVRKIMDPGPAHVQHHRGRVTDKTERTNTLRDLGKAGKRNRRVKMRGQS